MGEDILGGGGGEGGAVAAFEARLGAPVACEDQPSALCGDHINGGPLLAAVWQRAVHLVRVRIGVRVRVRVRVRARARVRVRVRVCVKARVNLATCAS